MNTPLFLALPRLHAEFLPSLPGCRTFWPGLPGKPDSAWSPAMPLPPAMAAACLTDYERACRDGASGSPVLAMGAEPAPADLSDAERRALRDMAGLPAEEPRQPLRQHAQQILLLVWLQEKQALDMAELERKIRASRQQLAGLISGTTRQSRETIAPSERDLPDWKRTLSAVLAFVPDTPESVVLVVSDASMKAALDEMHPEPADLPNLPSGFRAVRMPVSGLAALCGRTAQERLGHGLSSDQWQRTLTLCLSVSGD